MFLDEDHKMFIALAKNVQTNGSVSVTSSPLNASNTKNAITETKKSIQ